MNRIIDVASYGLAVFSIESLSDFVTSKNLRINNVLSFFQNNFSDYLESLKNGVWTPILPIDSIEYEIKITNLNESFNNDWELKFTYGGFNLNIINNSFWIISSGQLSNYNKIRYEENNVISYKTLDNEILNSGFKIDIDSGKYNLTICGYERKNEVQYPQVNYGYLFTLNKVDSFKSFNDPRDDDKYNFNLSDQWVDTLKGLLKGIWGITA